MRLRKVKNAKEKLRVSSYYIENPCEYKGKWSEVFGNDHSIHLEIGMGKGSFLIKMAMKYPLINFIGMEKYESVLIRAKEKLENLDLPNLKIILYDAININEVFDSELTTIYLNFSDPWPKNKQAKRRLTSPVFLKCYESLFKMNKHIIQKTDNILLFAYSLKEFSQYGYIIKEISLDLEHSDIPNESTEYEDKFMKLNQRINYVEVEKSGSYEL